MEPKHRRMVLSSLSDNLVGSLSCIEVDEGSKEIHLSFRDPDFIIGPFGIKNLYRLQVHGK
jgi:hypothetical protein